MDQPLGIVGGFIRANSAMWGYGRYQAWSCNSLASRREPTDGNLPAFRDPSGRFLVEEFAGKSSRNDFHHCILPSLNIFIILYFHHREMIFIKARRETLPSLVTSSSGNPCLPNFGSVDKTRAADAVAVPCYHPVALATSCPRKFLMYL